MLYMLYRMVVLNKNQSPEQHSFSSEEQNQHVKKE